MGHSAGAERAGGRGTLAAVHPHGPPSSGGGSTRGLGICKAREGGGFSRPHPSTGQGLKPLSPTCPLETAVVTALRPCPPLVHSASSVRPPSPPIPALLCVLSSQLTLVLPIPPAPRPRPRNPPGSHLSPGVSLSPVYGREHPRTPPLCLMALSPQVNATGAALWILSEASGSATTWSAPKCQTITAPVSATATVIQS